MSPKPLTKILVVDDDQDTLTIARFALESLKGVEVQYLLSGEEAVKAALTMRPDLILLDVMMPKMDGIATMRALRLIPSLVEVPIIFFTAKVQKDELETYRKLGVWDVVVKPFDPLTLGESIQAMWNRYQEGKK